MNKNYEFVFISLSDPRRALLWKLGKIRINSKKPFLPYNLKRYSDTIFYTMTCKASQTLEIGSFKTASLPSSLYSLHQKKKLISPVIPPQPQSNLASHETSVCGESPRKQLTASSLLHHDLGVHLDAWGTPAAEWVLFHFTLLSTHGTLFWFDFE